MATELYGVYGQLLTTEGRSAVTTETNVIFVGAAPCGDGKGGYLGVANTPVFITSEKEYSDIFGGAVGDGWSLSEAVEAAFRVCNIRGIWVINVNSEDNGAPEFESESEVTDTALIGNAGLETGCYAIQKLYPLNGAIPNIACVPVMHGSTSDILSALQANMTKTNGHWDGIIVYDVTEAADQINANDIAVPASVVSAKNLSDERAVANWGHVITSIGLGEVNRAISGAAVKACLYAQIDASNPGKLPSRTIGNVFVSGCLGFCLNLSGTYTKPISMSESAATMLSADGITTWLNKGGGRYYTWGDHTSAFSGGAVADERARFDVNMRMMFHLLNRFQAIWSDSIDSGMTLSMRDSILTEENEYLGLCVGLGALIGYPECIFAPENNDTTATQGQFFFKSIATATPPMKYAELGLAFTTEGYSVYTQE